MDKFLNKYWKIILTAIMGVGIYIFFAFYYFGHLYYQEQLQLFIFDFDYWKERIAVPGGFADYIAEFLVQFYYYASTGALIISLLLISIQLIFWRIMRKENLLDTYYPVSFIPAFALVFYYCDEHALLSFTIALLIVLCATLKYTKFNKDWKKIIYLFFMLPFLYGLAGPVHFVFLGWLVLHELFKLFDRKKVGKALIVLFLAILYGIACPLFSSYFIQYPLYRLFGGINYYRFPSSISFVEIVIILSLILLPFILRILPNSEKKRRITIVVQLTFLILIGWSSFHFACDMNKEEAMRYDYWVKKSMWNKIISAAEKKTPDSPFTVTCLNLALAKTGQLGDRMFEFYQNGTEGLLPEFQRDFISPLPTGEAFYQLGMINTAQRFAFEAMEAIPNFRKSSRCYKRLAETNIINGQYKVASKYLQALSKTLFYRSWAKDAMTYLYNENKINSHPEWGRLRQLRYTDDFLFSDKEIEVMLGLLVEHNYKNKMAFEYMLAYVLEKKDIPTFMKYYPLGKKLGYDHIPRSYQEALVYVWTQSHPSFQGMPWSISPQIMEAIADFARIYTQQPNSESMLKAKYGGTYWYYYLFRNN
ncbi:hypothetical protein FQ707_12425 [Bacteroidaceae bacterium HV4-6-C5C]|nr:hypothetical protein FQ707_12425 [Bacteroidaceae bacterium HV4-6-C5C]